jgi:hypothetical protein
MPTLISRTRTIVSIAIFCLWVGTGTTHAGPPFITDDPEPVDPHHWEINLASEDVKAAGNWSGTIFQLDVAYGLLPDVELNFLTPLNYQAPRNAASHIGYGDTEIGFKYRFVHQKESKLEIGIAPVLFLPTGDHHFEIGNGKNQLFLPLWLQKSWGKWTLYGGGGYTFNPGDEDNLDFWYTGAVIQRKISDTFALGLEVFHIGPQERGEPAPTCVNVGATLDLNEHCHLLAAAGHSIEGRSFFTGYFALQITLGPEEKKPAPAQ